MDAKDRKILAELAKNSRMPVQQLARKVRVSREVVAYRMKRLVEQGMITDFYTIIDTSALGYSRHVCFIQLQGISMEEEKNFFSWITWHNYLTYVGTAVGRWNVIFDILSKDKEHLKSIIQEILNEIRKYLDTYVVISVHAYESFPVKIVGGSAKIADSMASTKVEIDATDRKLLELLSKNARIEYKELAPSLHMTANAVKYRILRLQKEKVILGYTISLDAHKIGYELYNVQVKYLGVQEEKLLQFLRGARSVIYFYRHLGNENWDFDMGVAAKNSLELRYFLMALRKEAGDGVKVHDVYAIGETIKSDHVPKGVFL